MKISSSNTNAPLRKNKIIDLDSARIYIDTIAGISIVYQVQSTEYKFDFESFLLR